MSNEITIDIVCRNCGRRGTGKVTPDDSVEITRLRAEVERVTKEVGRELAAHMRTHTAWEEVAVDRERMKRERDEAIEARDRAERMVAFYTPEQREEMRGATEPAYARGKADGRVEERADVVAWLASKCERLCPADKAAVSLRRDDIDDGLHVGSAPTPATNNDEVK